MLLDTDNSDNSFLSHLFRARDSTFSALSLLSPKCPRLWRPFLLRNVRLDKRDLPSFCSLLLREDAKEILSDVEHLIFVDVGILAAVRCDEDDVHRAWELLSSRGIGTEEEDLLDASRGSAYTGMAERINIRENAVTLVNLLPFFDEQNPAFNNISASIDLSQEEEVFSAQVIYYARGLIIQSCSNLQTLSVHGSYPDYSSFPFWDRTPIGSLRLISQSLRTIYFRSRAIRYPDDEAVPPSEISHRVLPAELSVTNILFLINLPQLSSAILYGTLNWDDVRFLKSHSPEGAISSASNIKRLELEVVNEVKNGSEQQVNKAMEHLLSFTKQLERLSLMTGYAMGGPVQFEVGMLDGLKSGFTTLKSLWTSGISYSTHGRLPSSFTSLESLAIDYSSCAAISGATVLHQIQSLPLSLKEIRILKNSRERKRRGSFEEFAYPEYMMYRFIDALPELSTIKTIILPKSPVDGLGTLSTECLKDKTWLSSRASLKGVCLNRKMELKLVDNEERHELPSWVDRSGDVAVKSLQLTNLDFVCLFFLFLPCSQCIIGTSISKTW